MTNRYDTDPSTQRGLQIVFFGVHYLGAAALQRLHGQDLDICAVVTKPDDPGYPQVVAEKGRQLGLPVLQPQTSRGPELHDLVSGCTPDLIVVAGYPVRLPMALLEIPRLGAINTHLSMLPRYRGPVPYKWAIINGESTTGVTIHLMTEEFDAGEIIAQRSLPITDGDTADSLFARLSDQAADLLEETIEALAGGTHSRLPQDPSLVSYHPNLTDVDTRIDWEADAQAIHRLVRGLTARPGAWFMLDGQQVRVERAEILGRRSGRPAGTVLSRGERTLTMATGSSDMEVQLR